MDKLDRYLQYQKEVAEAKLKIIDRLQRQEPARPRKRTSNIDIVQDILKKAGHPLHVSEIIRLAKQDYDVNLNRDSIVSALLKKVNAGKAFIRTAPSTFFLKTDSDE